MAFDVLVQGKLRGQLTKGTASNGTAFGRFKLGLTDKNGESLLASCITFAPAALAIVARLDDGDAVAVSGEAAITTWQSRDGLTRTGLDVLVATAMTPYHAARKRGAQSGGGEQ